MQSSTLNIVQSLSTAGASRVQIGNTYNTTNHYQRDIDHENKKLLEALRSTDPRQDKVRIEQTNNHLLRESYMWILENPDFLAWQDATHGSRLWIRGDPGKGKTMLLCGIIDELLPSTRLGNPESQISLSYFFCQAANPGLSNSTAVLEGLTYLLLVQQPGLLSHLQDAPQYNPSHWNSRRDIEGLFCRIVSDPAIQEMYLIVDALDECVRDVPFLLEIISRPNPRIKWIISSRNRCEIEKDLERSPSKIELSLELCQGSISQAVRHFINYRTCQVVKRQKLKYDVAQRIQRYLIQNAQDTFLWVALVCERLERCQSWEVSKQLLQFPKGLSKVYERMIEEVRISDSRELYIRLLAMALTVFRPLTFSELLAMEQLEANGTLMDENILANVIKECGSFLTSKEKTIIFIHQSAREYLNKESIMLLYPSGLAHYHYTIFRRSIDILEVLRKDIYNLKHPGTSLDVAIRNRPDHDPLRSLTYALVFWHDHIREAYELSTRENTEVEIPFVEIIYRFLSKKFLLWLEALSLCHNLSVAGKTLLSLRNIPAIISHSDATALIEDAIRFLLLFSPVIEDYPLQTYASGLLFSPQKSIIRRLFKQYTPEFIATGPRVEENWSPILSVFETPSGTEIRTMIFSSTSNMLAMTMSDSQLLIRNVGDGSVLRRSKYENATLLTPSPDLRCLASIITRYSVDTQELIQDTLEVRDIDSNNILWTRTLDGREALVMGFSPDGKWLAVCYREELHVFNRKGELVQSWGLELGPHILCQDQIPWYLTFSSDCAMLLLRYYAGRYSMLAFDIQTSTQYKSPEVCNTPSNQEIWFESVEDAKFIPGTHQVMMCVDELGIYIWDFLKGECEEFFECDDSFSCIALSHAEVFTQACEFLSLWDRHEKSPLQYFKLPRNDHFKEIQVSDDGKHVAVCSSTTVWLVEVDAILDDKPRSGKQKDMIPHISSNGTSIAYHDFKNAIEIHNQRTGVFKNTLDIKGKVRGSVHSMAFSPDGQLFAFSDDSFLNIWDLNQGSLRHSLEIPARAKSIAISGESANGQWVAVCTAFEVLTWDVNKGQLQRSIQSPGSLDRHPYGACFAGTRLGVSWYYSPFQSIGSIPHEIFVLYDIKTGQHLSKLNLPCSWVLLDAPGGRISVSPNGKWVVSYVFECRRLLLSDVEKGIQYAVIDVNATWFSFTDDVTLFTEKGVIHLDHIVDDATVISERDRSQTVEIDNGFGLELPVVMPIFGKYRCSAHCEWITINDSPLLWLPKQYRFGTQKYLGEMAIGYHYVTMDSFSGLYYIRFAEDAGDNF